MIGIYFIAIIALIGISAFFSAAEMAFASLNEQRLKAKVEKNGSLAKKTALKVYKSYDKSLAAILIGNNLANVASSSIATLIVMELNIPAFIATAVMTVLLLICSEITPKTLAKAFSEQFSSFAAIPVRIISIVLTPVIFVVTKTVDLISLLWENNKVKKDEKIIKEDLESIFSIATDEGALDETKGELFINALGFDDTEAYEVMTPRVDIKTFDINDRNSKILDIAYNSRHSKIPVYEDDIDNIIGVLHLNKLFKELAGGEMPDIRKLLDAPVYVSKKSPLNEVVNTMKEHNTEICMVSDEFGGLAGLITMEDTLEELVGEIWDESDEIVEDIIKEQDGKYIVKGSMRMFELYDELDFDFDNDEPDETDEGQSIGGFVFEKFEEIPPEGSFFEYGGYVFTVTGIENHRVEEVTIEKQKEDERKLFDFSRREQNESEQNSDSDN